MSVRQELREKRHRRVRAKVKGTAERPRLCIFRSQCHIYAQLIDDVKGHTLTTASTVDPSIKGTLKTGANIEAAKAVGKLIAERAKEQNVTSVVFDRGGFRYHGRVQHLADAAREGGLEF